MRLAPLLARTLTGIGLVALPACERVGPGRAATQVYPVEGRLLIDGRPVARAGVPHPGRGRRLPRRHHW